MPRTISPAEIPPPPAVAPNRIHWTVQQCNGIRDSGILTGRYELIDGEIISKMGQKPSHAFAITELLAWLVSLFGSKYVRIQLPINVNGHADGYDEPEPDVVVTIEPNAAYSEHHPYPSEVLLVIEASDSTLRFDRSTKSSLYARSGISEYWIVDIPGRQVLIHRQPVGNLYSDITAYGAGELV